MKKIRQNKITFIFSTILVMATIIFFVRTDAAQTPTVTKISPCFGRLSGGTAVIITGTNFGSDPSKVTVTIGGVSAGNLNITVNNPELTELTCETGDATATGTGLKDIVVNVSGGGGSGTLANGYNYVSNQYAAGAGGGWALSQPAQLLLGNYVTVKTPNAGEKWYLGANNKIEWATSTAWASIEYSTDLNGPWISFPTPNKFSGANYSWPTPSTLLPGNNYYIKVANWSLPDFYDVSDSPFSLMKGILSITSTPVVAVDTAAEWLKLGDSIKFTITPDVYGSVSAIDGRYNGRLLNWSLADYSATYYLVEGDSSSLASYLEINGVKLTDSFGGVTGPVDPTVVGSVGRYIDTVRPAASVNIPKQYYTDASWVDADYPLNGTASDAGLVISDGVDISIMQDYSGVKSYWDGSAFTLPTSSWINFSSPGLATSINWKYALPKTALTTGATYTVWVRAKDRAGNVTADNMLGTGSFAYYRDGISSISLSPLGPFVPGKDYFINWSGAGNAPVKLSYSSAGVSYPIADFVTHGSFLWRLPNELPAAVIQIKAELVGAPEIFAESSFTITKPSISFQAPVGGESWYPNQIQAISWTTTGAVSDNIKLEYFVDGSPVTITDNFTLSAIGNSGSSFSGATAVTGKLGNAASFNGGGQYIKVDNDVRLNPGDNFTLEAWVKPSSLVKDSSGNKKFSGGDNYFNFPGGVAVDGDFLYISDSQNSRIEKRKKSDSSFVCAIGKWGTGSIIGPDTFAFPYSIAFDDIYLYINDSSNNRIVKRQKSDLKYYGAASLSTRGSIAVYNNSIYAVNTANNSVAKVDASTLLVNNAAFISKWTNSTGQQVPFANLNGVAVDSDGNIYVSDGTTTITYDASGKPVLGNSRVIKFSNSGAYISQRQYLYTNTSGADQYLNSPSYLAVDDKYLYVNNAGNNYIEKLLKSDDLTFVKRNITSTPAPYQLWGPLGIAVDTDTNGYIYAADSYRHRIVKGKKSDMIFTSQIGGGASGSKAGISNESNWDVDNIAVDSDYVYTTRWQSHSLEKRKKSDLSFVAWAGAYADMWVPRVVAVDNNYIYMGSGLTRLTKLRKSDLTTITTVNGVFTNYNDCWNIEGLPGVSGIAPDDNPESTGFIYAIDRPFGPSQTGSRILKFNKSDLTKVSQQTMAGTDRITKPMGIAYYGGKIYIVEAGNLNRILIFNAADLSYDSRINLSEITGLGSLVYNNNSALFVDANYIYLMDAGNNRVIRITKTTPASAVTYGSWGSGSNKLWNPTGVTADSDYIYIPDNGNSRIVKLKNTVASSLPYDSEHDSSAWFSYPSLIDRLGLNNNGYALQINSDTGKFRFVVGDRLGGAVPIDSTASVSADVWQHIAVSAKYDSATDKTNIKIYVNGALSGTGAVSGHIPVNSVPLIFGASGDYSGKGFFSGLIDEAAVWNKELSSAEITSRYNSGNGAELNGSESELISAWHFNENSYDGAQGEVLETIPLQGSYNWTIPYNMPRPKDVTLKISQNYKRYFIDTTYNDFNDSANTSKTEITVTGTSAPGTSMDGGIKATTSTAGVFTKTLDTTATGNAGFGRIKWNETLPAGTSITMKVRTSSNGDFSSSNWNDVNNGDNLFAVLSASEKTNRYIQYQATLTPVSSSKSPALESVLIEYYDPTPENIISATSQPISIMQPKLGFTQQPKAAVETGENMGPVKVQIQTDAGASLANDNGTQVTLSSSGGTGKLSGTLTVTASGGVATFDNVAYNKIENINLVATALPVCTQIISNAVTVKAGRPSSFELSGIQDPITAGQSSDVTVTVRDASGNIATDYAGTIKFFSDDSKIGAPPAKTGLPPNFSFDQYGDVNWQQTADTEFVKGAPTNIQVENAGTNAGLALAFDSDPAVTHTFNFNLANTATSDATKTTADWDDSRAVVRLKGDYIGNADLKGCWLMEGSTAAARLADATGSNSLSSLSGPQSSTGHRQGAQSTSFIKTSSQGLYTPADNLGPALTGANKISISGWIEPTISGSATIVALINDVNPCWRLYINTSNKPVFALYDGAVWHESIGLTTLSQNTWYHLTGTYDKSNINIYVNGNLDHSETYTGDINSWNPTADPAAFFSVGFQGGTGNNYFNGLIDEVAVFSRSLTAAEVSLVYNNGLASIIKYTNSNEVRSLAIDNISANIKAAKLTATEDLPPGTSVAYFLNVTTDDTKWEQIANRETHTFTNLGSNLRCKAILSTTNTAKTPVISGVSVDYMDNAVRYVTSGTFISETKRLGTTADIRDSNISWQGVTPAGTRAELQIAINNDNFTWNFIGPDGTSATTYTDPAGTLLNIPGTINASTDRYVRYKLFLYADPANPVNTPVLNDLKIAYQDSIAATGTYTFKNGITFKTSGEKYVEVQELIPSVPTAVTKGRQSNITINPAAPDRLAITPLTSELPSPYVVGAKIPIKVEAWDNQAPNLATNNTSPIIVNLAVSGSSGTYSFYDKNQTLLPPGPQSVVTIPVDGTAATKFYYSQTGVSSPALSVSAAGLNSNPANLDKLTLSILADKASQIRFYNPVNAIIAGEVKPFTLQTTDSIGNLTNVTSGVNATVLLSSDSPTAKFYNTQADASNVNNDLSVTSIIISGGTNNKTFYFKDTTSGTCKITASATIPQGGGTNQLSEVSTDNISVSPAEAKFFSITSGGNYNIETVTGQDTVVTIAAYDDYGNIASGYTGLKTLKFSGTLQVSGTAISVSPAPSSKQPLANGFAFGEAQVNFGLGTGSAVISIYKTESEKIILRASDGTAVTTADDKVMLFTVKPGAADHLKFEGDILVPPAGIKAGQVFPLPALVALDAYDNLCDTFSGSKTLIYKLKLQDNTDAPINAPNGLYTDALPNSVNFDLGKSSADLTATLYRAQTITVSAKVDVVGFADGAASNVIAISDRGVPDTGVALEFAQTPPDGGIVNVPLVPQPWVKIPDLYGNPVMGSSAQVTLEGSLQSDSFVALPNGKLSGDNLIVSIVNGLAKFSGIKCNFPYPDGIYLRAYITGNPASAIKKLVHFDTGKEATIENGSSLEPQAISSVYNASDNKLPIFDFKISDTGGDFCDLKIKEIKLRRSNSDETGGWNSYIAGASLFDGNNSVTGSLDVNGDTLIFNTENTYSVTNNFSKTYVLSIYLKKALPSGADKKIIAFEMNPYTDIILDPAGSSFKTEPQQSLLSNSLMVDVVASKFNLILKVPQVAQVLAGDSSTISLTATDANNNIDLEYGITPGKDIYFSGANAALTGEVPTCTNPDSAGVDFNNPIRIIFADGVSSDLVMKLYKREVASIKAQEKDDHGSVIIDSNDLPISVIGNTPVSLSWLKVPVGQIVANAPWRPFSVQFSDKYQNISSSTATVKLELTSGNALIFGGEVAAVEGAALFDDFKAKSATDSYPLYIKLRAIAPAISGVTPTAESGSITIYEKYGVKLRILDTVTGTDLDGLNMDVTYEDQGTQTEMSVVNKTSPIPSSGNTAQDYQYYRYRPYNFKITKDAYVDGRFSKTPDYSADALDGSPDDTKITWTVYLMSVAESLSDYHVLGDFVYDEDADRIAATVRLEKRGKQITNTSDVRILKNSTLDIYDSLDALNPKVHLEKLAIDVDANGNYWFDIANATKPLSEGGFGFVSGKSYFAKMSITYGMNENALTDVTYAASTTFSITITTKLKDWISTELQGQLGTTAQSITQHAEAQTKEIKEHVSTEAKKITTDITDVVKPQLSQILTATGADKGTTLPEQIKAAQEKIESGILNRETSIKTGGTMTISYRTKSGVTPVIDVYDSKEVKRVVAKAMEETAKTEDGFSVYTYGLKFERSWGMGDFTVVCSEQKFGTADAIVISVTRTDVEEVSGIVSGVLGTTSGLSGMKNIVDTLNSQFALIDKALTGLSQGVMGKVEKTKGVVNDLESVYNQLTSLSGQIKKIGGTQGLSLEKLYQVSKDKKDDITYLKNKAQELKATMEINQKMMQNVANKPVVQSWFEFK